MKHTFNILLLLLLLGFGVAKAQSNWKLVYENDNNGDPVAGKIENLISAIQEGKQVRIYFIMGRNETYVEHTTDVKFTTVMSTPDGKFVTAQIDPIVGQIPNFENGTVSLKENLEWSLIASTTGSNDQMTRNLITGEIVEHSMRTWGTKWFVKE